MFVVSFLQFNLAYTHLWRTAGQQGSGLAAAAFVHMALRMLQLLSKQHETVQTAANFDDRHTA